MLCMSAATPPLSIYFKDMQRETLTISLPFETYFPASKKYIELQDHYAVCLILIFEPFH